MSDANISAALAWLEGSWQAADNRSEAARAAKCIRDQAVEVERLREALLIVAQGTRCPELFPNLSMQAHEWQIQAQTAEVAAIAALEPRT